MGNKNGHLIQGLSKTPLYAVWQTMKQRCYNHNCRVYEWYGGKGIGVCDEWQDVKSFCEWAVNNGYEEGLTLDRKDIAKNYEPGNCRWITMSEQQSNKSSNHNIECNGEIHTLTKWGEILGIPRSTLSNRLNSLGWSVQRAFRKEVSHENSNL